LIGGLSVQWLSAKWATTAAPLRWKEDRATRRREYWRRAAAVNQGSGAAAAGEWEILPTEDEHLKALGFAVAALCVGVLVTALSPAAAVAAAVPAKQLYASSVAATLAGLVHKGPKTEAGAFLSWFVPWFFVVAVQKS
jgi:hypothetical protein